MKRDLFIIESPFQLLCAIEALNHFKPEKSVLIIKYTREAQNNNQIDKLVQICNWTKIVRFRTYISISLSEIFIVPYIFALKFIQSGFNRIFIGESRSVVMQAFFANVRHNESLLLDDGNATFYVQEQLRAGEKLESLVIQGTRFKTLSRLYYSLFCLHQKSKILPNWFSCFKIDGIGEQKIYQNSFSFIRLNYLNKDSSHFDKVYFIGGNLSETGILNLNDELRMLSQAFTVYLERGKSIVYCVHRRDSEVKLQRIKSLHEKVILRYSQYPLELDLIFNKVTVQNIASFYSTALITIKRIFGPQDCRMFIIPESYIADAFKEEIGSIYNNYQAHIEGFKLT